MDTKTLVENIAKFHKNYKDEFLTDRIKKKDDYLKNSKDALFFILSYSFYQGRRDKISSQFEGRAKETLNQYFSENGEVLTTSTSRITSKDELKEKYRELYNKLKENKVNKEGDRLMVISLVNLIQSSSQKNILKFLIEKIKSNTMPEIYKTLDGIWSIGPKIASLILRDIVYIYELEKFLKKDDYHFLQPIDTWVHKISKNIGLINKDKIYKGEAKDITDKCFEFGVNPIYYNQGAWYIGAHSLQILLRNIELIR